MSKPTAVIFDLDGTLASCAWRLHHIEHEPKDWDAFFDGIPADAPVPGMVAALRADVAAGHSIQIVTGRPASHRRQTQWWLAEHAIPYDTLHMRPRHSQVADYEIKAEILAHLQRTHDIVRAVDDRDGNIAMFMAAGIPVTVAVDPGLPPIMSRTAAKMAGRDAWWHSGDDPASYTVTGGNFGWAHLGTPAAAGVRAGMDLARPLWRVTINPRDPANLETSPTEDYHANQIDQWLRRGAQVDAESRPTIPAHEISNSGDLVRLHEAVAAIGFDPQRHDAIYYRNDVEDPGSVSVMVDPRSISRSERVHGGQMALFAKMAASAYSAWVVDPHELLTQLAERGIAPAYDDVLAHQVFGSTEAPPADARITVLGYTINNTLDAVVVDVDGRTHSPRGIRYHITLSLAPGGQAQDAGPLAAEGHDPIDPFTITGRASVESGNTPRLVAWAQAVGSRTASAPLSEPERASLAQIHQQWSSASQRGVCERVSAQIAQAIGWPQVKGIHNRVLHAWNVKPDGTIIDATADQFGGEWLRIESAGHPDYRAFTLAELDFLDFYQKARHTQPEPYEFGFAHDPNFIADLQAEAEEEWGMWDQHHGTKTATSLDDRRGWQMTWKMVDASPHKHDVFQGPKMAQLYLSTALAKIGKGSLGDGVDVRFRDEPGATTAWSNGRAVWIELGPGISRSMLVMLHEIAHIGAGFGEGGHHEAWARTYAQLLEAMGYHEEAANWQTLWTVGSMDFYYATHKQLPIGQSFTAADEYADHGRVYQTQTDALDDAENGWHHEWYEGIEPVLYLYVVKPRGEVRKIRPPGSMGDEAVAAESWRPIQLIHTDRQRLNYQVAASKTASGGVLYHAAPRAFRESIEQYGLDWRRSPRANEPQHPNNLAPVAIYFHRTREAMDDMMGGLEDHDLYEVDATGLELTTDPYQEDAAYTLQAIPPSRVRRVTASRVAFATGLDWRVIETNAMGYQTVEAVHHGIRFVLQGMDKVETGTNNWGKTYSGGWTIQILEPGDRVQLGVPHRHRFEDEHWPNQEVKSRFDTLTEAKTYIEQRIIGGGVIDQMVERDLFPQGEVRYHLTMTRHVQSIMATGLDPRSQVGTGSSVFANLKDAGRILWDLKNEDWAAHTGETITLLRLDVGGMPRSTVVNLSREERVNEVVPGNRISIEVDRIPWYLTESRFSFYSLSDHNVLALLRGDIAMTRRAWTGQAEELDALMGLVLAKTAQQWPSDQVAWEVGQDHGIRDAEAGRGAMYWPEQVLTDPYADGYVHGYSNALMMTTEDNFERVAHHLDGHRGPIYRGFVVDLSPIRGQVDPLLQPPMEEDQIDQHLKVGSILLDWLQRSHWDSAGLGRHWTTSRQIAESAQGGGSLVVLTAQWNGEGNDSSHTNTTPGLAESESEVTIHPGTRLNITSVYIEHNGWRGEVLGSPMQATASWRPLHAVDWWTMGEAVIAKRTAGGRPSWEVFIFNQLRKVAHSFEEAKAVVEAEYGPLSWVLVDLPEVMATHYHYGPTTEFTDPASVWVVESLPLSTSDAQLVDNLVDGLLASKTAAYWRTTGGPVWRGIELVMDLETIIALHGTPALGEAIMEAVIADRQIVKWKPDTVSGLGVHWSEVEHTARNFPSSEMYSRSQYTEGRGPAVLRFPILLHGMVEAEAVRSDPEVWNEYDMVVTDQRYDLPIYESEVPVAKGADVLIQAVEAKLPSRETLQKDLEKIQRTGYGEMHQAGSWHKFPVNRTFTAGLQRMAMPDAAGWWYHFGLGTDREFYGQYTHLGTRAAATDRLSDTGAGGHGDLYRVRISPRTPLGSLTSPLTDAEANALGEWEDPDTGYVTERGQMPQPGEGVAMGMLGDPYEIAQRVGYRGAHVHDAIYYRNEVEDPGSVSVMVDSGIITANEVAPPEGHDDRQMRLFASQRYYHGTTAELTPGDVIVPASQHGSQVHRITDPNYAYASASISDAAFWAELAWNNTDDGDMHVYEVRPLGAVERDPNIDVGGRGGFSAMAGDVRSPDGFEVVAEVTPSHLKEAAVQMPLWPSQHGVEYEVVSDGGDGWVEVIARIDGEGIGRLEAEREWEGGPYVIGMVEVDGPWQRAGIATSMLEWLRRDHEVIHGMTISQEGYEWAQATGSLAKVWSWMASTGNGMDIVHVPMRREVTAGAKSPRVSVMRHPALGGIPEAIVVEAREASGALIGWIKAYREQSGWVIAQVDVVEIHQRQGWATKLLDRAEGEVGGPLQHSRILTDEGQAWIRSLGRTAKTAYGPPVREEIHAETGTNSYGGPIPIYRGMSLYFSGSGRIAESPEAKRVLDAVLDRRDLSWLSSEMIERSASGFPDQPGVGVSWTTDLAVAKRFAGRWEVSALEAEQDSEPFWSIEVPVIIEAVLADPDPYDTRENLSWVRQMSRDEAEVPVRQGTRLEVRSVGLPVVSWPAVMTGLTEWRDHDTWRETPSDYTFVPLRRQITARMASRHVTCEHGTFWGPDGAAGILVRTAEENPRYLLQERAAWVDHGGTWGIPGGALESGESVEQAAVREAREEGLTLPAGTVAAVHVNDVCEHWSYTTVIYEVEDAFPVGASGEASSHRWVTAQEASSLTLHPGLRETWPTITRMAIAA